MLGKASGENYRFAAEEAPPDSHTCLRHVFTHLYNVDENTGTGFRCCLCKTCFMPVNLFNIFIKLPYLNVEEVHFHMHSVV